MNHVVNLTNVDSDVIINFPTGKQIIIQARPSNADTNYNGSLDIILPKNNLITTWIGDDMENSIPYDENTQHIRMTKQISTELP